MKRGWQNIETWTRYLSGHSQILMHRNDQHGGSKKDLWKFVFLLFVSLLIPNYSRPTCLQLHWFWSLCIFGPMYLRFYGHLVQLRVTWIKKACVTTIHFVLSLTLVDCGRSARLIGFWLEETLSDFISCKQLLAFVGTRGQVISIYIFINRVVTVTQIFVLFLVTFWLDSGWGSLSMGWLLRT